MIMPIAQEMPTTSACKPIQVTWPDAPERIVEGSAWGNITNLAWSIREAERIADKGATAYVKQNGGDRIMVMRGDPLRDSGVIFEALSI